MKIKEPLLLNVPITESGKLIFNYIQKLPKNDDGNGWIYLHTNKINQKKYVGQTRRKDPRDRWQKGKGYLKNQQIFGNAIKSYGWNGFYHEAFVCPIIYLNQVEKHFVDFLKSTDTSFGYNGKEGGEAGRFTSENVLVAIDQYDQEGSFLKGWSRISDAAEELGIDGSQLSAAVKNDLHFACGFLWVLKGYPAPEPYIPQQRKVSCYKLTGEHLYDCDSLSIASKKTGVTVQNIHNCCVGLRKSANGFMFCYLGEEPPTKYENKVYRKVNQFDLNGNLIKTWNKISDICKEYETNSANICDCCNKKKKTHLGYIWRYADDNEPITVEDNKKLVIVIVYDLKGNVLEEISGMSNVIKKYGFSREKISWAIKKNKPIDNYVFKIKKDGPKKKNSGVFQYDNNGNFIKHWSTIKQASSELRINSSSISDACKGRQKTAGGFVWSFEEKKSFGKIVNQKKRIIEQYDYDAIFIKEWESMALASRELNIDKASIYACCIGKNKTAGGFLWCYKGNHVKPYKPKKPIKVYQYTLDGVLIKEWEKATDAAKYLKCDESNICACCNGKTKTCCGYVWKYK